jgi:hypothetical protein
VFRAPPQKSYVVYSVQDPDLNGEADRDKYAETLDPAHLGDVSKLTPITLHNLTVEERIALRCKQRETMSTVGITFEDLLSDEPDSRYYNVWPKLCANQVRASVRKIGDREFEPDADGFISAEVLDLLSSPDVVEEIASYVREIAHINPPDGESGGDE